MPLKRAVNHEMLLMHRNCAFGPNEIQKWASELSDHCNPGITPSKPGLQTNTMVFSGKQWVLLLLGLLYNLPAYVEPTMGGGNFLWVSRAHQPEPEVRHVGNGLPCKAECFSICNQPWKCPFQSRMQTAAGVAFSGTSGRTGLSLLTNLFP